MNIERVVMPYTGSEMGGSHISSFTLGEFLQKDYGIRVIVYAKSDTLISEEASQRGFVVRNIDEPAKARHNPIYDLIRMPARLRMLRREGKGTLVHCNDISALQSWAPNAKLLRMPVIYHNRAFNRILAVNTLPIRLADRVICVSQSTKAMMRFLPEGRAIAIDNPFALNALPDPIKERQMLLAKLSLSPDALIIGFAANFWKRKRPIFFLDVCKLIAAEYPAARFVVFGRAGDYTIDDLKAYAQSLGIGDRTQFAGFCLPGEGNIVSMDVHLIPALQEPFGRTPIESLLLGTPYVAISDGGNAEIGERFAGGKFLSPEASVEAFALAALEVIADPDATRLTIMRRQEVQQELSARSHTKRVVQVYREISR